MSASAEARQMRAMRMDHCLRLITRAANDGSECPTNSVLRERLGVRGVATVSGLVKSLEERGDIKVERMSDARIVEIVATGKKTATPALWRTTGASPASGLRGTYSRNQEKSDRFDDVLADTGDIVAAGAAIGLAPAAANQRFARIRKELGPQAK